MNVNFGNNGADGVFFRRLLTLQLCYNGNQFDLRLPETAEAGMVFKVLFLPVRHR